MNPIDPDSAALNRKKIPRRIVKKCGHKYKAIKIEVLHFLGTVGSIVTGA